MKTKWNLLVCAMLAGVMGCAGEGGSADFLVGPNILSLSTYSGVVGDPVRVVGTGFPSKQDARIDLRWVGTFTHGGTTERVNVLMFAEFADGNSVTIPYLGPFTVPFSRTGDQVGTFDGTITPVITPEDTRQPVREGQSFPVRFEVGPSIIVTNLQPLGAQCSRPAKRLLAGFAYRIAVKAAGFTPTNFTYQFMGLPNSGDRLMVRHPANGMTDQAGDTFAFVLDPVPPEQRGYRTTLVITSRDTNGIERRISLIFTVHSVVEVAYDGNAQVAQIYPPVPQSGCHSGSLGGSSYNFTESQAETRTRQLTISFDQAWGQSVGNTVMTGRTETNGVKFDRSTSDTVGWTTNTQTKLQGETSIGVFAKIALQSHYVQDKGFSGASTQGASVGEDHSRSDTVSEAVTTGETYSLARSNSEFFNVSSADQKSSSMTATIFAGYYGVLYRQTTRLQRVAKIISYNLCGEPTLAGETKMMDWVWGSDVAQDTDCTMRLPRSNLSPPACLIGPCD